MNRRRAIQIGIAGASLLAPAAAADLTLAVVVHAKNPIKLTTSELEAIYRVNRQHWPQGEPIVAFNLPPGSVERAQFDRVVLNLTPDQVSRYWIERRIRSGDLPPRVAPTPAFVARLVAQLPNAIGYLPQALLHPGLRAVAYVSKGQVAVAAGATRTLSSI